MKAFVNTKREAGNLIAMQEVDDPAPGPNDLLVNVKTVGLNRADLARGIAHPDNPAANIAGIEIAGEVAAVGADVTNFAVGDRVMSMAGKAYAEKAVVHSGIAMKIPGNLDFVAAAAIPVFFSTAHDAIVTNGQFRKDDTVLIQGVTAGVGIAMTQIAAALGASVIAGTSRSAEKLARVEAFGLTLPIHSGHDDAAGKCKQATGGRGIDVIIDNIGKGVLADNLDAAAIKGRIVSVGRLGGKLDELDLDKLALKRLKLIGVTFRTRSIEEKIEITRRLVADLGYLFVSGQIKPPIDKTFPFDQALEAQEYMRSNQHIGKIVLTL